MRDMTPAVSRCERTATPLMPVAASTFPAALVADLSRADVTHSTVARWLDQSSAQHLDANEAAGRIDNERAGRYAIQRIGNARG